MKKMLALLLALMMVLALASCGSSEAATEAETEDTTATETEDTAEAEETEDAEEAETEEAEDAESEEADAETESDLAYVQDKGTLVVGITDFEPMDYKDENGEWIGFDADMATAFAESLGVTVEFVEIEWDNKILELDAKSIDCVWNGMTLTNEVTSSMECSNAYCNNTQVVVLPSDVADQYDSIESLAELTFAVESGSAGAQQAELNGFAVNEVTSQSSALMEVAAGTSDAAIIDSLMAGAMVGEGTGYPDLTYTISLNEEEGEQYGVGFRLGSDLAAALNEFFAESYADGTMIELAETYGVQAALIAQ